MNTVNRRTFMAGIGAAAALGATDGAPSQRPWAERRNDMLQEWLKLLGPFPEAAPPLDAEMTRIDDIQGIACHRVTYQTEPDDRVPAYLLVPESATTDTPGPAMVCIHSTTRGAGKDQTVGLAGRAPGDPWPGPEQSRAYGLELARWGYVTLSIDLICDGERVPEGYGIYDTHAFYERHPEWSAVGKNTWDVMRGVDFLDTLDFVDHARIGCIGHSLGGHSTVFAAAFDPRIAAAVSNGGQLSWVRDQDHWSRPPANTGPVASYIYLPWFRPYIEDPAKPVPVDFEHLMMLVAPRPLLIMCTEDEAARDHIADKTAAARAVYRQQGVGAPARNAGDRLTLFTYPGAHNYPPVAKRFSFAWLDRWMNHTPGVQAIWP